MNFIDRIIAYFGSKPKRVTKDKPQTGFIKFFNRSRGYGFIQSKGLSKRIFVHVSEIKDRFRVGDRVRFELDTNSKGLLARNVQKLNPAE